MKLQRADKQQYFLRTDEPLILWIPIIGIIVVLAEAFFFREPAKRFDPNLATFIAATVMLSVLHLIFPVIVLFCMPHGREFLRRKFTGEGGLRFSVVFGLAALTLYGLSVLTTHTFHGFSALDAPVGVLYFWIWALFPTYHGLRQSHGFSVLLNKSLAPLITGEERVRLKRFESRERLSMKIYCACILGAAVVLGINAWKASPWTGVVVAGIIALAIALAALQLYWIKREPYFQSTNKFMFSVRFLLWPVGHYFLVAPWAIALMHGTEYYGLMRRSVKREGTSFTLKAFVAAGALVGFMFFLALISYLKGLPQNENLNLFEKYPFTVFIFAMLPFIAVGHYIVDGLIYRTRDKDVAACMGRTLIGFSQDV